MTLDWMRKRLGLEAVPFDGASSASVEEALAEESIEGLRLSVRGRLLALTALAVMLPVLAPYPDFFTYYVLLGFFAFATLGLVFLQDRRRFDSWALYGLIALDFAVLSFGLNYPNPVGSPSDLWDAFFQNSKFIFFYVFLIVLALSCQSRLVLWGGCIGALSWLAGSAWLYAQFDEIDRLPVLRDAIVEIIPRSEEAILDPYEWIEGRVEEAVVFLLAAGLLALVVQRSRRLVFRQVRLARERNNLARYFPPSLIEDISESDTPLGDARELVVTVLFADIVGFTKWAEGRASQDVIAFLREVHSRFEAGVFKHGGTLDKFTGDGIMATFGTPEPGRQDALNALGCAVDLVETFAQWSAAREAGGLEAVQIGVGIHTGPVVMGDIGSERRLELAVLGDTVNLASRLEGLTRDLGCRIVASGETIEAVRHSRPGGQGEPLSRFTFHGSVSLRGRSGTIPIWTV